MSPLRILCLAVLLLGGGCTNLPGQGDAMPDESQRLREALRKAEDEKLQLLQQLAELQHRDEEEKQKLHDQLAERQRRLRDEQRKVEMLEAKVADLEKKVEALRRIDRETLKRAIRR
ncbi:hypothetical protein [Sulfuricystis multivorans]|uniref:hypothetical protein n=1 Tax=Sulfuricystis multivorans TaxID=2211108 RepID=UPI000F84705A|nr:hypothetical protein [Sulfuricystis multivorans]